MKYATPIRSAIAGFCIVGIAATLNLDEVSSARYLVFVVLMTVFWATAGD
jgi:SNF family Na+-dependent transporter